jgi:hypothetical protein
MHHDEWIEQDESLPWVEKDRVFSATAKVEAQQLGHRLLLPSAAQSR